MKPVYLSLAIVIAAVLLTASGTPFNPVSPVRAGGKCAVC
jgi:hypothetical protein